jgi:phosphatidylserine/phosphatidylglycerophosphate/cardiolipin synthase-like enzyme
MTAQTMVVAARLPPNLPPLKVKGFTEIMISAHVLSRGWPWCATRGISRAMRIFMTALLLALCSRSGWGGEAGIRTRWKVYFSPHGGCTEAVIEALDKARSTVLVQAFSFTSAPIAKALVEAHRRGVKTEIVLDRSQRTDNYSSGTFFHDNAVPCYIDAKHAVAHNKVMVIDGETVITGSFNFTKAAEDNNAENLLVIRDSDMASKYARNWDVHRQHSKPYTGPATRGEQPHSRKRAF